MLNGDTMSIIAFAIVSISICALIGTASGYPVAQWLSERMTSFFLGFSTERFDKPQPLIGKATAKAVHGDPEGAAADYEEMLEEHPTSAEVYLRLMELAYGPLKKPDYGDEILERGIENVTTEREMKNLLRLGTALKEGKIITHKHLGWHDKLDQGIQPPLLHLGDAAILPPPEKS